MFNMSINPTKSIVVTNQSDIDQPNRTLHINNIKIPQYNCGHTLTRFLGVHWNLTGNYKPTFDLAYKQLNHTLHQIKHKHLPGDIITSIIKTVLQPTLAYRLQCIHLTNTQLDTLDIALRKALRAHFSQNSSYTKAYANFPSNASIHDPAYGLGLPTMKDILEQRNISNLQAWLLNKTHHTGQAIHQLTTQLSNVNKLPIHCLHPSSPKVKKGSTLWIGSITNVLKNYNLGFSLDYTPPYSKTIPKHIQLRGSGNKTLSWNTYLGGLNPRKREKQPICPPTWYKDITTSIGIHTTEDINDPNTSLPLRPPPATPSPPPEAKQFMEQLDIFTDGSYDPLTGDMGAAAILINTHQDDNNHDIDNLPCGIIMGCPTNNENPSSTKPELLAIYLGLKSASSTIDTNEIHIMTDSQAAKAAIEKTKSPAMLARRTCRYKNHSILIAIKNLAIDLPPIHIHWVKGHNGHAFNEAADKYAGTARTQRQHPTDILTPQTLLLKNEHPLDQYAGTHIKKTNNAMQHTANITRLTKRWSNLKIDAEASIKLNSPNKLLRNENNVHTRDKILFRINSQHLNLYTIALHHKHNKLPKLKCPHCPHTTADQLHLMSCPHTLQRFDKIHHTTTKRIRDAISLLPHHHTTTTNPGSTDKKEQHIIQLTQSICNFMGINNRAIMHTSAPHGIIPLETTTLFKTHFRQSYAKYLHIGHLAFWDSIYEIIWLPYKKLVHRLYKKHNRKQKTPIPDEPDPD